MSARGTHARLAVLTRSIGAGAAEGSARGVWRRAPKKRLRRRAEGAREEEGGVRLLEAAADGDKTTAARRPTDEQIQARDCALREKKRCAHIQMRKNIAELREMPSMTYKKIF